MVVIIEQIQAVYEKALMECQYGFRTNRSMTDAIFVICNILQNVSGVIYTCFIDLRAAYDHLPRSLLLDALQIRTEATKQVDILRHLSAFTTAQVSGDKDIVKDN